MTTVKSILSAKGGNVITIDPNATLEEAAKSLAAHRIGALVVTGPEQRIVGIVSERDVVAMLASRGCHALDVPLTSVMTRKVATCSPGDTIASIMERMTEGKFRHVPVVEQSRLTGIISIGDVVKHRLQEMEQEQNALRDYIQTA
jgi:CBS domain-containing protein